MLDAGRTADEHSPLPLPLLSTIAIGLFPRLQLRSARQAEFEHYQRNRGQHDRFRPMADTLLHAVIDAAISAIGLEDEPEVPAPPMEEPDEHEAPAVSVRKPRIVMARKPRVRR